MSRHPRRASMVLSAMAGCAAVAGLGSGLTWAETGDGGAAPVHLLFHADLDGRFADVECGPASLTGSAEAKRSRPSTATLLARYPLLVDSMARTRDRITADGSQPALTLLGGNVTAPDLLGRGFVEGGRTGARRLAALLGRGRYDAIGLGHHDLSLGAAALDEIVGALATSGIPVLASNLICDGSRRSLCAATRPYLLIRRGATTVGVMATISPSVLPGIGARARAGLRLEDPGLVIRRTVRRMRAAGATRVIVMTQGPRGTRALEEIDALQRSLGSTTSATPGAATRAQAAATPQEGSPALEIPDLILAGGLADEESDRALRHLARAGAPPVVGSEGAASGVSQVLLPVAGQPAPVVDLVGGGQAPPDGEPLLPDEGALALLRPEIESMCRNYGIPVAAAPVQGVMSRDAFASYALEVMRRRAGAEIAIMNRAAVKRRPFPLTGTISRGALHQALPYRAVIGVARLPGGTVESLLGGAITNTKVAVAGLGRAGGSATGPLQVNGRPIDKARAYRVATIDFIASGGDAIVPAGALPWRPLEGEPDLRDTVAEFLRGETARRDGDPSIALGSDFGPAPSARTLLVGLGDIGLDLADTRVTNAPSYGDAQLTRASQRLLKGDATAIAQLRHPMHEGDARLNLKYGWTRSQPVGAPAVSGETTDLITFTTVYNFRGLRHNLAQPRRHIPDPYVRASVESEFTRPALSATQTRGFHHLELTNTAGALFTLAPALKVRGGAGVRKELLTGAGELGRWRPLIEAGGTLAPVALATVGPLAVRLEGLVDYYFIDPAGTREHQLRGSGKLSVPLLPLLFITAGVDVFAVQRQRQGWGASYDTTVGLRLHLDAARQWM